MRKGLFAGLSPLTELIMLAFFMLVCCMMVMFAGILLAPLIIGIPVSEMGRAFSEGDTASNLNMMRYMQTLYSIGLFILPAFVAAYLFSENALGYLRVERTVSLTWFGLATALMLSAIPCINFMGALNEMIVFPQSLAGLEQRLRDFEEAARQTTHFFLETDNVGGMLFNMFMIALLPSIGEELIFRGLLQKIFVRWTGSIHAGIIIAGFLFSLMHFQFYGLFPRWVLGVMFGYLFVWSGTVWLPIFAHFINNAVAVFITFLIHKEVVADKIEVIGANQGDIPATIATTAICAIALWFMYSRYRNSRQSVVGR